MSSAKVFRCPLLSLLPAMLLLAAQLPGQEQGGGEDPGLSSDAAAPGGDLADTPAKPAMEGIFFDIRVQQDPMRIAPGERGNLLLIVTISAGDEVDPTGSLEFAAVQGPFSLAAGRWDSPPAGKRRHTDTFLIRLPLQVAGGTAYGKYPVSGEVKLTGKFGSGGLALLGNVNIVDDTGMQIPELPVGLRRSIQPARQIRKATGRFSYQVDVGAPMPRASLPQARGAKVEASTARGKGRSSGDGTGVPGHGAQASAVDGEILLPDAPERGGGADLAQGHEAQAPGEELFGGIPSWVISLGLVAMAGLLFFMQKKR